MADTYIKISELEETTLADDSSFIPIDNGNHTYKITVENYNSGANATAQSYAEAAAASADDAETAKTAAETAETETGLIRTATQQYATAASGSASAAASSAVDALNYADSAASAAANAADSAQDAAESYTNAAEKAVLSESWAVGGTNTRTGEDTNNSQYYAAVAKSAAENAEDQVELANAASQAASGSAVDAAASATEASGYADDASDYATAASGSATAAAGSATQSANSAGAAATSATNAAASATAASGSASTATTQANNAAQSATTAGGYATQAASSASDASGYATNAANSATAAAGSATTATNQATAAVGSATAAAASASDAADSAADAAESAATFTTDDTLSIAGKAADAKAAGDMIAAVQDEIPELDNWLTTPGAAAEAKHTGDRLTEVEDDVTNLLSAVNVVSRAVGADRIIVNALPDVAKYVYTDNVALAKGHRYTIKVSIDSVQSSIVYTNVRTLDKTSIIQLQIAAGKTSNTGSFVPSTDTVVEFGKYVNAQVDVAFELVDENGINADTQKNAKLITQNASALFTGMLTIDLPTWEQGGINPSGATMSSADDIRSATTIKLTKGKYLIKPNGYKLYYFYYNSDGSYAGKNCANDRKWGTTSLFCITFDNDVYLKFVQANTGIKPSDATLEVYEVSKYNQFPSFANGIVIMSKNGEGLNVPPYSLYAVREVYENGYDGFRMNVCKTSDGHYVLSHDRSINSIAKNADNTDIATTVNIDEHTLEELNEYDYGIRYGTSFAGTKITEFADAVKLCSKLGLRLDIEWEYPTMLQDDAEYIYGTIVSNGYSNRNWHWIAFNQDMVSYFKSVCDYVDIEVLITASSIDYYLSTIENAKSENHNVIVGYSDGNLSASTIVRLRKLNVVQNRGTASNITQMVEQIESGVTEIECNFYYPKKSLIDYALNN